MSGLRYVAIGIGCLECGMDSEVLVGFESRAVADEWAQQNGLVRPQGNFRGNGDEVEPRTLWTDNGGQYCVEVHEIPAVVVE